MSDPALIRTAIDQARQTALQTDGPRTADRERPHDPHSGNSSDVGLERGFRRPFNRPVCPRRTSPRSPRRGAPKFGARIERPTFTQIIAETAATFAPVRRTSLSALSR